VKEEGEEERKSPSNRPPNWSADHLKISIPPESMRLVIIEKRQPKRAAKNFTKRVEREKERNSKSKL